VILKANRIGKQEKYISAISRSGEVDIRVVAEVVLAPELVCARTNITILKTGVYKIPIKLQGYAEVNQLNEKVEFDLSLGKEIVGIQLRKNKIWLQDGVPKAVLLSVSEIPH
jgi:hypothetical protein